MLLFVAVISYTISAISDPDPNCDVKQTCKCGQNFTRFLGVYLIVIVCHTVFKVKFYCRAVTREVRRRELKVVGRQASIIFTSIFIIVYTLILFAWYGDVKNQACNKDSRYSRLKQLTQVTVVFIGLQCGFMIAGCLSVIAGMCKRHKRRLQVNNYESSDEVDEREFFEELNNDR